MTKTITIDFETRSEADLRALGPWAYAEHASTEIMCIAVKIDGVTELWIPEKYGQMFDEFPEYCHNICDALPKRIPSGYALEAHNAEFERAIWHHICHKRWGWPDIPIDRWRCSAAKAAALSLPRALDNVCDVLELPVQKDAAGKRLMLKMCKPRKPLKAEKIAWLRQYYPHTNHHIKDMKDKDFTDKYLEYAEYNMPVLWHETKDQLISLFKYCIQDVEAEVCLSERLRPLSPKEQKLWEYDQLINQRGVKVDVASAMAAIAIIEKHEATMLAELETLTSGTVRSPKQTAALGNWLRTKGLDLPNLQKATVGEALSDGPTLHPDAFRALQIRQSLSKSSTAKFKAMVNGVNKDDRARGLYMYHGAGPGRWTGKRIQTQNLVRSKFKDVDACINYIKAGDTEMIKTLWGDPMAALASCLRGMLVAGEGNDLICADFSSIESRVLKWKAGDLQGLQVYLDGLDPYKFAACDIYPVHYDSITADQRQIGKVAELALGYQGGVKAFQSMAVNYGVIVSEEEADKIKKKWRAAHPEIVHFWYNTEKAAISAVRNRKTVDCQGILWGVRGDFLFCKLPSGRILAYYKPKLSIREMPWGPKESLSYWGVDTYTRQWTRIFTYGGKLVENVVQAISRDLLSDAIMRVEDAGYPVVMHVHDEIVSEIPEGFGSLKEFEALMSVKPHWAEGCPIGAEGWRGKRYRK